jgi:hypothetical protein
MDVSAEQANIKNKTSVMYLKALSRIPGQTELNHDRNSAQAVKV